MINHGHTAPNGQYVPGHYDEINERAALDEIDAYEADRAAGLIPVAYDGFGAPLYAHQVPPEGTE